MRFIGVALLAVLALACGSDPEPGQQGARTPTAAPKENEEPVIRSAQIVPARPTAGDSLSLNLKAVDVDGDPLAVEVEWFRNGTSIKVGPDLFLKTDGFVRGDQIYAAVRASDGKSEVTERTTPVNIVNQPPRVSRIQLAPEELNSGTDITAVAEASDGDGDPFELRYEWLVNGEPTGVTKPTLPADKFKRGDQVVVRVIASDPSGDADPVSSEPVTIPNGAPEIKSRPSEATVGGGRYRYVIKAEDPDGDRPLRYVLEQGPDGMTVDLLSGVVSWRVPASAGGDYPIEVRVSDPQGATTQQSWTLQLSWQSEPADTP